MKLVFFCNYLNHHQVAVADAFYSLLHDEFRFVATRQSAERYMKGGQDYSTRPYCVCSEEDATSRNEAIRLAQESEIALFGAESQYFAVLRAKNKNADALSFEIGERWLKRGWMNIFSPVLMRWLINYWLYYRHRPFYKLNSSAFGAEDHYKMRTYRGRCYKWGYFTEAEPEYSSADECSKVRLLWVGRFLEWKHPELAVNLAYRLKTAGRMFCLDMIGEGPELENMKRRCLELEMNDVVSFLGSQTNQEVKQTMKNHDVVLLTSDRNEGWGVVANEAMSCGCVLVGSDQVGSVPYLVQDGENGLIFASEDIDSLESKVEYLLDHPAQRKRIAQQGWNTLSGLWSSKMAANNLLQLIQDLQQGRECSVFEGPCSIDIVK